MSATSKPVWIWLPGSGDPVQCGVFDFDGGARSSFSYSPEYVQFPNAVSLDPMRLRFGRKRTRKISFDGLPGFVQDTMPAGYGADLLNLKAGRSLAPFEMLEVAPADAVGSLAICDDIQAKIDWRPLPYEKLKAAIASMREGEPVSSSLRRAQEVDGTSAGGEKPKATVVHEGRLWIAKLADRGELAHAQAKEFVVMRMASHLGLNVPQVRFERINEHEVFLIERFDRAGDPARPTRVLFASAHTVLGLGPGSVRGDPKRSYLVLADELRAWTRHSPQGAGDPLLSDPVRDAKELWNRMVFNALVGNLDDHPRNHGLLNDGKGWSLSPLFDVTPLRTYTGSHALYVCRDSLDASLGNLLGSAAHFGVELEDAIDFICKGASFVSQEWARWMRDIGVSEPVIDDLRPAFIKAHEWADLAARDRLEALAQAGARNSRRNSRSPKAGMS